MVNCSGEGLPYWEQRQTGYFIVNAAIIPPIAVITVIGNLLNIIAFNSSHMRVQNAVYVYLTGMAVLDLVTIGLITPEWLRNMNLLSPQVAYSRQMAQYESIRPVLRIIVHHASVWIITFAVFICYARSFGTKRPRWTKISASRIIVFVITLACLILHFARFFETRPMEYTDHCFKNLEIYGTAKTAFASNEILKKIYPWASVALCVILPYFILFVTFLLLACRLKFTKLWRNRNELVNKSHSHDETLTAFTLLIIAVIYTISELPYAVAESIHILTKNNDTQLPGLQYAIYAAGVVSLIHCGSTCPVFMILSRDYCKSLRRLFCCLCVFGDDYYEPMITCPSLSCCKCKCKKTKTDKERGPWV